jgi:hypothetical protein
LFFHSLRLHVPWQPLANRKHPIKSATNTRRSRIVLRMRAQPCDGFELRKKVMMEAGGTGKGAARLSSLLART